MHSLVYSWVSEDLRLEPFFLYLKFIRILRSQRLYWFVVTSSVTFILAVIYIIEFVPLATVELPHMKHFIR
jgi:hypothetical protein